MADLIPVERLPPLADTQLSDAQRQVVASIIAGPRGGLRGPFVPMLRSPELALRASQLGEYLRFNCAVPKRLREFAILLTAAHWRQNYEWHAHASLAGAAGVAPATLADLAAGRKPTDMADDEAIIYEFCTELHRDHQVTDRTYGTAVELLGEPGVVDLCGLCGYYALLAMLLNVAVTPLPQGATHTF